MTQAQNRVLNAAIELTRDGWPCTTRELAKAIGNTSPAPVHEHLHYLLRAGLIEKHPRAPRGGYLPTSKGMLSRGVIRSAR